MIIRQFTYNILREAGKAELPKWHCDDGGFCTGNLFYMVSTAIQLRSEGDSVKRPKE